MPFKSRWTFLKTVDTLYYKTGGADPLTETNANPKIERTRFTLTCSIRGTAKNVQRNVHVFWPILAPQNRSVRHF
jgi:hypothetical protein